jgi:hypothetical protein
MAEVKNTSTKVGKAKARKAAEEKLLINLW